MSAGDLSGDTFNEAIDVPYNDVQFLAGNASFGDIDINANGSVNSGSLALIPIGTNSVLRYVFPANFAVGSATMSVAANVTVVIQAAATLTDNGTLSFAAGDSVALNGTAGGFGGGACWPRSRSLATARARSTPSEPTLPPTASGTSWSAPAGASPRPRATSRSPSSRSTTPAS